MTLRDALVALDHPRHLEIESTRVLAARVDRQFGPVGVLNGRIRITAADVLAGLALTFKVGFENDTFHILDRWAQLKYLGAFSTQPALPLSRVRLTQAAADIADNQRRIMSEELGIAFALAITREWQRNIHGIDAVTRIVDLDTVIRDPTITGLQAPIQQKDGKGSRADYLVLTSPRTSPTTVYVSVLECKGTRSEAHSISQLKSAASQLTMVSVAGVIPPALAVSTITGNSGDDILARALTLTNAALRTQNAERIALFSTLNGRRPLQLGVDLGANTTNSDRVSAAMATSAAGAAAEQLMTTALRSSFAQISMLSGNDVATNIWARDSFQEAPDGRQLLRTRRLVNGVPAVGVTVTLPVQGDRVTAFIGVATELDDALTVGDTQQVLAVQSRTVSDSRRRPRVRDSRYESTGINADGLVVQIRVED